MLLYLVPVGGISGDMFLGCLLGFGIEAAALFEPIRKAGVDFSWHTRPVKRAGLSAHKVDIEAPAPEKPSRLEDILRLLERVSLPQKVLEKAASAFQLLASVEAEVHGQKPEEVHFHELGAIDSIIDVLAAIHGVHLLGVEAVYAEPVPLGSGWLQTSHGRLPLPAPATVRLLEGIACYKSEREGEHVTPTGALLLRILGASRMPANSFVFKKSAGGAGSRDEPGYPNVLMAHLIEPAAPPVAEGEVVEAVFDADDMSGEEMGHLRQMLAEAGVHEVAIVPAYYKKGRPGYRVHALLARQRLDAFAEAVFRHSSTFGFRYWSLERRVLDRNAQPLHTPLGTVSVKTGRYPGGLEKQSLEYEDLAALAHRLDIPLVEVRQHLEGMLDAGDQTHGQDARIPLA